MPRPPSTVSLAGAAAVINCAGPFASTSAPVIEAALARRDSLPGRRGGDRSRRGHFEHYAARAREAGIVIVPAMAFYGGLGDLLATAAMGTGRPQTRLASRTGSAAGSRLRERGPRAGFEAAQGRAGGWSSRTAAGAPYGPCADRRLDLSGTGGKPVRRLENSRWRTA